MVLELQKVIGRAHFFYFSNEKAKLHCGSVWWNKSYFLPGQDAKMNKKRKCLSAQTPFQDRAFNDQKASDWLPLPVAPGLT